MLTGTLRLCLGSMGAGKSYRRGPYELVRKFFSENRSATFVTNIPVSVPAIAAYCEEWQICKAEEVRQRLVVIPVEVDEAWRDRTSEDGPWNYFEEHPELIAGGRGCRLVLDEGHMYVSKLVTKDKRTKWELLIRGARHMGLTIELLTQGESLIDDDILEMVETRVELFGLGAQPLPLLGIQMNVWWNIEAYFTRRWRPMGRQVIKMKAPVRGGYEVIDDSEYSFDKALFALYDSFGSLQGASGGGRPLEPWERLKGFAFAWWVAKQTPPKALRNWAFGAFCLWFAFFGGVGHVVNYFTMTMQRITQANMAVQADGKTSRVAGTAGNGAKELRAENLDPKSAVKSQEQKASVAPAVPVKAKRRAGAMAAALPGDLRIFGRIVELNGERGRVGAWFETAGSALVRIDSDRREVVFEDGTRYYAAASLAKKRAAENNRSTAVATPLDMGSILNAQKQ